MPEVLAMGVDGRTLGHAKMLLKPQPGVARLERLSRAIVRVVFAGLCGGSAKGAA